MHEEYIHAVDQAIESKLKQSFSGDQIQSFYDDFKADFQSYKETNPDAYEILKCQIDFQYIKDQMIKYKQGAVNTNSDSGLLTDRDGAELFWELFKEDISDPAMKWRKSMDVGSPKDGYTGIVYQKPSPFPGASIDLLRGEMCFTNCTREMWFDIFKDGPPVSNLKAQEVVEEVSPNERIIYMRISLPIMSDRDQLLRMKRVDLNDKESLLLITPCVHPAKPILEDPVRAQNLRLQYLRQEGADLKVTNFITADMKGYFPPLLMNMQLANIFCKGMAEVSAKIKSKQ